MKLVIGLSLYLTNLLFQLFIFVMFVFVADMAEMLSVDMQSGHWLWLLPKNCIFWGTVMNYEALFRSLFLPLIWSIASGKIEGMVWLYFWNGPTLITKFYPFILRIDGNCIYNLRFMKLPIIGLIFPIFLCLPFSVHRWSGPIFRFGLGPGCCRHIFSQVMMTYIEVNSSYLMI